MTSTLATNNTRHNGILEFDAILLAHGLQFDTGGRLGIHGQPQTREISMDVLPL